MQQLLIVIEDFVVVGLQELGRQHLVLGQQLLEGGEGIGGDVEGRDLDVLEEVVEVVGVKQDLGQRLVADTLAEHGAAVQGDLLLLVAGKEER